MNRFFERGTRQGRDRTGSVRLIPPVERALRVELGKLGLSGGEELSVLDARLKQGGHVAGFATREKREGAIVDHNGKTLVGRSRPDQIRESVKKSLEGKGLTVKSIGNIVFLGENGALVIVCCVHTAQKVAQTLSPDRREERASMVDRQESIPPVAVPAIPTLEEPIHENPPALISEPLVELGTLATTEEETELLENLQSRQVPEPEIRALFKRISEKRATAHDEKGFVVVGFSPYTTGSHLGEEKRRLQKKEYEMIQIKVHHCIVFMQREKQTQEAKVEKTKPAEVAQATAEAAAAPVAGVKKLVGASVAAVLADNTKMLLKRLKAQLTRVISVYLSVRRFLTEDVEKFGELSLGRYEGEDVLLSALGENIVITCGSERFEMSGRSEVTLIPNESPLEDRLRRLNDILSALPNFTASIMPHLRHTDPEGGVSPQVVARVATAEEGRADQETALRELFPSAVNGLLALGLTSDELDSFLKEVKILIEQGFAFNNFIRIGNEPRELKGFEFKVLSVRDRGLFFLRKKEEPATEVADEAVVEAPETALKKILSPILDGKEIDREYTIGYWNGGRVILEIYQGDFRISVKGIDVESSRNVAFFNLSRKTFKFLDETSPGNPPANLVEILEGITPQAPIAEKPALSPVETEIREAREATMRNLLERLLEGKMPGDYDTLGHFNGIKVDFDISDESLSITIGNEDTDSEKRRDAGIHYEYIISLRFNELLNTEQGVTVDQLIGVLKGITPAGAAL